MHLLGRCLFVAILVFAPVYFGGNRPHALLVLTCLALLLVAVLAVQHVLDEDTEAISLPKPLLWLSFLLLVWPLVTLIPIPFSIWQTLPSKQTYANALVLLNQSPQALPLTLVPMLTEFSWLALIAPLAVFWYVMKQASDDILMFIKVFLIVALLQALLGLIQYGDGAQSIFRLPNPLVSYSAVGTYANRDHLAGLLEMALPIALAMFAAYIGGKKNARTHHRTLRQKLAQIIQKYVNSTALYALMSLALLLGLVFTQSRMGVVLSMVVILMTGLVFSRRLGGSNAFGLVGTITVLGVSLAAVIGLVPVLNRFTSDPLQDLRWTIYQHTWQAVQHFWPLGAGVGTYKQAMQAFQVEIPSNIIINHAHNDYLEWLMEAGVVAAILMLGFLLLYLAQWFRYFKLPKWSHFQFAQVGAGIGLFAMLLHTFFDFNLHIPANQIYFAFLAAVFFYQRAKKIST